MPETLAHNARGNQRSHADQQPEQLRPFHLRGHVFLHAALDGILRRRICGLRLLQVRLRAILLRLFAVRRRALRAGVSAKAAAEAAVKSAVCLAAAFLLLCSTAFAGQTVTLDKYGVSFTVPDGFTWVKTEDAELLSDDVKKLLENDQAIGGMVNKNHDHLSLTIVEDEYINAINYDALSDEKLVALFGMQDII